MPMKPEKLNEMDDLPGKRKLPKLTEVQKVN